MMKPAKETRVDVVAPWLTGFLVIALPLCTALVVRLVFPNRSILTILFAGGASFLLCLIFAERLWRTLKQLSSADQSKGPAKTGKDLTAELISQVLLDQNASYSRIMKSWPSSRIVDPLISEAFVLLTECADRTQDTFNQRKLNYNLKNLTIIMEKLREQ